MSNNNIFATHENINSGCFSANKHLAGRQFEDDDIFLDEDFCSANLVHAETELIELESSDDDCCEIDGPNQQNDQENDGGDSEEVEFVCQTVGTEKQRRNSEELELDNFIAQGPHLVNEDKRDKTEQNIYVAEHLNDIIQPHQLDGIRFMYKNVIDSLACLQSSDGNGCILAHNMGLGKTLQAIAFVELFLRISNFKRVLILLPVNVIHKWAFEFDHWLPDANYHGEKQIRNFTLHMVDEKVKGLVSRADIVDSWHTEGGVFLLGYEMFRRLVHDPNDVKKPRQSAIELHVRKQELENMTQKEKNDIIKQADLKKKICDQLLNGPDLVICDEGHRIKNQKTGLSKTLEKIRTRRRIVLTGSPLQNNLTEYFYMVNFVRPNFLGNWKQFNLEYELPIKKGINNDCKKSDSKEAKKRMYILRTQKMLERILPENKEYVIPLRKSSIQHRLYKAYCEHVSCETISENSSYGPIMIFATCLKIVNHPDILYGSYLRYKKIKRERLETIQHNETAAIASVATEQQQQNNISHQAEIPSLHNSLSIQQQKQQYSSSTPCWPQQQQNFSFFAPNNNIPSQFSCDPSSSSFQQNSGISSIFSPQISNDYYMPSFSEMNNMMNGCWEGNGGGHQQRFQQQNLNGSYFHHQPSSYSHSLGGLAHQQHFNTASVHTQSLPPQQQNFFFQSEYFTPVTSMSSQAFSSSFPGNQSTFYSTYSTPAPNLPSSSGYFYNNAYLEPYLAQRRSSLAGRGDSTHSAAFTSHQQDSPQHNSSFLENHVNTTFCAYDQNQPQNLSSSFGQQQILSHSSESAQQASSSANNQQQTTVVDNSAGQARKQGKRKKMGEEIDDLDLLNSDDTGRFDWAGPLLTDDAYREGLLESSTKFVAAMELIFATLRLNEKILLFSQSLDTLTMFERFLTGQERFTNGGSRNPMPNFVDAQGSAVIWAKNKTYLRLDGATTSVEREVLIDRFNTEPELHLFLISTKAGSLGINLVSANRVIVFDACFNPTHDSQAISRVYRYGQKRRTFIYRLVMDNCMERKVFNRQIQKHGLHKQVIDKEHCNAKVKSTELDFLQYDESRDANTSPVDLSKFETDDDVLQELLRNQANLLSEVPFLHKSMISETTDDLSAKEILEAEQWFQNDQRRASLGTSFDASFPFNGSLLHQHWRQSTPLPATLSLLNKQQHSNSDPPSNDHQQHSLVVDPSSRMSNTVGPHLGYGATFNDRMFQHLSSMKPSVPNGRDLHPNLAIGMTRHVPSSYLAGSRTASNQNPLQQMNGDMRLSATGGGGAVHDIIQIDD